MSVLIVDDSFEDGAALRNDLTRLGVTNPIRLTQSGIDAIAYLEGAPPYDDRQACPPPSAILLDLKMPGMDGFEFLKWFRHQKRIETILVFVISATNDMASIRRAYDLGATSFLNKSYRRAELKNLIEAFPSPWFRKDQVLAAPQIS